MEMFKMKSINRSHAGLVSFLNMIPVGYTIVLYYDYYCFIPPVVINTHNLASYDSWVWPLWPHKQKLCGKGDRM